MASVASSQIQVKSSYCTKNLTFQQLTELYHLSLSPSTSFPHWDRNQQKFDAFSDICYQQGQDQIRSHFYHFVLLPVEQSPVTMLEKPGSSNQRCVKQSPSREHCHQIGLIARVLKAGSEKYQPPTWRSWQDPAVRIPEIDR
jgi:hypothetical protein